MMTFQAFFVRIPYVYLSLLLLLLGAARAGEEPLRTSGTGKYEESRDFFHFKTRPDIVAPRWSIEVQDEAALSPGHLFIAPYQDVDQTERGEPWVGPFIYDNGGELIWAGTPLLDHYKSFDFKVSQVNGTDMLTVIYPLFNGNLILDSSYGIVKRAVSANSYDNVNMHDFNIIKNGTAAVVLTKYNKYHVSTEQAQVVGQTSCTVHMDGIEELDITGEKARTVFAWNGTDHIGLDETTFKPHSYDEMCRSGWDINHFNSIDTFPDGDYLLSSRSTSTVYKISHRDGSIVWRLGGVKTNFQHGRGTHFSRQHHARVRSQNSTHAVISLFDNAIGTGPNEHATHDFSRGLLIALDVRNHQAELVAAYDNPNQRLVNSRGSTQVLPDGNVFMGWVYGTLVSEHAPDGTLLMQGHLLPNLHTYRAYKYVWKGQPLQPPNVYSAAFIAGANTTTMTYVSWNGATEVARWNLYEAEASGHVLGMLTSRRRNGFETELEHNAFVRYVVVEAVDEHNNTIGRSDVFMTIPPVQDETAAEAYAHEVGFAAASSNDEMAYGAYDSASQESSQGTRVTHMLTSPAPIFILGFTTCAAICAVLWLVGRSKNQSWWKLGRSRYESVRAHDDGDWERGDDVEESRPNSRKGVVTSPIEEPPEKQPLFHQSP